jgi:hypothetical protein
MNLERVAIRKTDLWKREDEEIYILDATGESIHKLNQTASCIWELCDGSNTVEKIILEISSIYDVDTETAAQTTVDFLETMVKKDLIEMKE